MAVTHAKVSAVADSGDTSLVQPSDWNAAHVGALEVAQATVDFGATEGADTASVSVAATWATSSSIIVCTPGGASADHDAEDALIEGITASVTSITNGVGFTVTAHAPAGTWGRYTINCAGV